MVGNCLLEFSLKFAHLLGEVLNFFLGSVGSFQVGFVGSNPSPRAAASSSVWLFVGSVVLPIIDGATLGAFGGSARQKENLPVFVLASFRAGPTFALTSGVNSASRIKVRAAPGRIFGTAPLVPGPALRFAIIHGQRRGEHKN